MMKRGATAKKATTPGQKKVVDKSVLGGHKKAVDAFLDAVTARKAAESKEEELKAGILELGATRLAELFDANIFTKVVVALGSELNAKLTYADKIKEFAFEIGEELRMVVGSEWFDRLFAPKKTTTIREGLEDKLVEFLDDPLTIDLFVRRNGGDRRPDSLADHFLEATTTYAHREKFRETYFDARHQLNPQQVAALTLVVDPLLEKARVT